VIWSVDFEQHETGAYTDDMGLENFGPDMDYRNIQEGRAEIVYDDDLQSKVLKLRYPQGCVGSQECAIQARTRLDTAMDTAWVRYKLKFAEDFEWVRGGKLPGLCGGRCNTGCMSVSGTDGWSARIMWRGGGSIVQYMYYPDKQNSCGDDFEWSDNFSLGGWHEVKTQVIMNTPGENGADGERDGMVRSWYDGELSLERNDIRFRDIAELKIDRFYFSTFFGGSADSWAPSRDVYVYFDDIEVTLVDPDEIVSVKKKEGKNKLIGLPIFSPVRSFQYANGFMSVYTAAGTVLKVEIMDVHGKKQSAFMIHKAGFSRYPVTLDPGIYYLRVRNAGVWHWKKLVVI
jgi:hypothetical protein